MIDPKKTNKILSELEAELTSLKKISEIKKSLENSKKVNEHTKNELSRIISQHDRVVSKNISEATKEVLDIQEGMLNLIKNHDLIIVKTRVDFNTNIESTELKISKLIISLEGEIKKKIESRVNKLEREIVITRKLQIFIIFVFISLSILFYSTYKVSL